MKITNYNDNINFGIKLNTGNVLEVTSLKIFQSEGLAGCKEVVKALNKTPIKATGNRGYKYYAKNIGQKIMDKYPKIAEATDKINLITAKNPDIKKQELNEQVQAIIKDIGNEIDIVI